MIFKAQKYIFNQLLSKDGEILSQKEVWANSREHSIALVKKLYGNKYWYEFLGQAEYNIADDL